MRDYPEADWKTFRELREVALDRYCRDVLKEVQQIASDKALTHHERFQDDLSRFSTGVRERLERVIHIG